MLNGRLAAQALKTAASEQGKHGMDSVESQTAEQAPKARILPRKLFDGLGLDWGVKVRL